MTSPAGRPSALAYTPSWLCPSEQDWLRFLDLESRIKGMRLAVLVSLFLPGTVIATYSGALAWLVAVLALVVHLGVNTVSERMRPTARRGVATVVSFQVVLLSLVLVTGGAASPCLPWLAVPNTILATRYRSRVVAVGVVLTVPAAALVCLAATALGTPPDYPGWTTLLCLAGLATACGATSLALQGAELDSRRAADLDPLTGLHNRNQLPLLLDRLASAAADTGHSSALLACDIDHFKRVNDEHGHAAGDDVLRSVAARLSAEARPDDKVFRVGGEEFLVVVPDIDVDAAATVAERLRQAVAAWPMAGLPVTMSVGVAMLSAETTDAAEALKAADVALYAAKRGGRDRVCTSRTGEDVCPPVQVGSAAAEDLRSSAPRRPAPAAG